MHEVTLSFDNGPHPDVTPFVLDTLAQRDIRTTFFAVGFRAAELGGMDVLARAHAAGHWIGNHTWTHSVPLGYRTEPDLVETELETTQRLLAPLASQRNLFRPFGGGGCLDQRLMNGAVLDYLCRHRFTCVLWNAIPRDWADPDVWVETALAQVASQPWSLMVLHDLPTGAMRHLPRFLDALADQGIRVRQDFPPECVPIVDGTVVRPIENYVTPANA